MVFLMFFSQKLILKKKKNQQTTKKQKRSFASLIPRDTIVPHILIALFKLVRRGGGGNLKWQIHKTENVQCRAA